MIVRHGNDPLPIFAIDILPDVAAAAAVVVVVFVAIAVDRFVGISFVSRAEDNKTTGLPWPPTNRQNHMDRSNRTVLDFSYINRSAYKTDTKMKSRPICVLPGDHVRTL